MLRIMTHSFSIPYELFCSCRMTHPGPGLPADIIRDMYEERKVSGTEEGLALNLSRKLLRVMKGHVNYVRDDSKCCFIIDIELKTRK